MLSSNKPDAFIDYPTVDGFEEAEARTILVASAMSLLAYEDNPQMTFAKKEDENLASLCDDGLLSQIWHLKAKPGKAQKKTILLGWSPNLNCAFVAYRGTQNIDDWMTNSTVQPELEEASGWPIHRGFCSRARESISLLQVLVQTFPLVLCGHSLGGAIATAAGLLLETVCTKERVNVWEELTWKDALKISIITFGAPTTFQQQPTTETPTVHRVARLLTFQSKPTKRTYHNVILDDDFVPFVYNAAREGTVNFAREHSRELGSKILQSVQALRGLLDLSPALRVANEVISYALSDNASQILLLVLSYFVPEVFESFFVGRIIYPIKSSGDFEKITGSKGLETCLNKFNIKNLNLQDVKVRHGMKRYYFQWARFCHDKLRLPEPLLSQNNADAESFRKRLFPSNPIVKAVGLQSVKRIDFVVEVSSYNAPRFVDIVDFSETDEVFDLDLISRGDSTSTLGFAYPIPENTTADQWGHIINGLIHKFTIWDIFGNHTIVPAENVSITFPNLTHIRVKDATGFIKEAMLRAMVDVISRSLDSKDGLRKSDLGHLAKCIDEQAARANPHLYALNFRKAYNTVAQSWQLKRCEVVSNNDINNLLETEVDSKRLRYLLNLILSSNAVNSNPHKGAKSDALSRLRTDEHAYNNARPPGVSRDMQFRPSFRDALFTYSRAIAQQAHQQAHANGASTEALRCDVDSALENLQLAMIANHHIINSQLMPPPGWLFARQVVESLSDAFWATIRGEKYMRTSPRWDDLGRTSSRDDFDFQAYDSCLRMVFNAAGWTYPVSSADAEIFLGRRSDGCDNTHETEQRNEWSKRIRALNYVNTTDHFWTWISEVESVGRMRSAFVGTTNIGVIGPSRRGKSNLLTQLFGLDQCIFNAGGDDKNRTIDIRSHQPQPGCLLIDFPGTNEQYEAVRSSALYAFDLLDITIVVIDFEKVHTDSIVILDWLAARIAREERSSPIRILLNKFDATIQYKEGESDTDLVARKLNDLHERKEAVVRDLEVLIDKHRRQNGTSQTREGTKFRTYAAHRIAAQRSLPSQLIIRGVTEDLSDVVQVCCSIYRDATPPSTHDARRQKIWRSINEKNMTPAARCVISKLRNDEGTQHLVWNLLDVIDWLEQICPEALGNQASCANKRRQDTPAKAPSISYVALFVAVFLPISVVLILHISR